MPSDKDFKGANTIPVDGDGRVYHVQCRAGEIANKIVVCADYEVAAGIAAELGPESELVYKGRSNRGYATYTGSSGVSVIGIGIGWAMTDFLLHEVRAIAKPPLYIVYVGHAGTPDPSIAVGTAVVVVDACGVSVDYGAEDPKALKYFPRPIPATILEGLGDALGKPFVRGRALSNSSWCSGELNAAEVSAKVGPVQTYEPDVYPLFWLAQRSTNDDVFTGCVSVISSKKGAAALTRADAVSAQVEVGRAVVKFLEGLA